MTVARREYSTNPAAVKARISRSMMKMEADLQMLKPLEEWDWEELQRGYPRGENGKFGAPPKWVNQHRVTGEVQRRIRDLTKAELAGHASRAMRVMVDLMENEDVDLDGKPVVPAATRMKAAEFIIEHVIGKATVPVEVEAGNSLKDFLASCMVNDDGEDAHPIVMPGEIVDDDDEDDDGED